MLSPMDMLDTIPLLRAGDYAALAALVAAWLGITLLVERRRGAKPSVSVLMERYRRDWMVEMAARRDRAFDVLVLSNLRQGSAFFASGSLIALGGVLALGGSVEELQSLTGELTFLNGAPRRLADQDRRRRPSC